MKFWISEHNCCIATMQNCDQSNCLEKKNHQLEKKYLKLLGADYSFYRRIFLIHTLLLSFFTLCLHFRYVSTAPLAIFYSNVYEKPHIF